MATLTREEQQLIVIRLACFGRVADIRAEIKEKFDKKISDAQVGYYDPTSARGQDLADDLRELFTSTRNAYKSQVADVPIVDRNYRLLRLQQLIDDPLLSQSPKTVLQALRQAAEEIGGAYNASGASPDVDNRIADLLAQLVSSRQEAPASGSGDGGTGDSQ